MQLRLHCGLAGEAVPRPTHVFRQFMATESQVIAQVPACGSSCGGGSAGAVWVCASRTRSAPNAADVPSTARRMLNCRKYLIGPTPRRRTGRPAKLDVMHPDEEAPAVGGGRGWVLETGCRRVSRRFDPARRWLAIGKDGVRHAPAAIRQVSRPR